MLFVFIFNSIPISDDVRVVEQ